MRDLLFWTLGLACGALLVYYRTERRREDAAAKAADLQRLLGGVQAHVAREPWPKPLHPREFDDMTTPVLRGEAYTPPSPPIDWHRNEHARLSWGWWVEKAQRLGTWVWNRFDPPDVGRHRPERIPAPTVRAIAQLPAHSPGDFTLDLAAHGLYMPRKAVTR